MNATQLLAHYGRIADSPDAIPRLRRFFLDLAVRGKLVEQSVEDEPASELLNRIAREKARLVNAGAIKRQKSLPSVSPDEFSIELPPHWGPARLADVAVCLDYKRKPINGTERKKRIEGKTPEQLFPYFGATQQQGWIDDYLFDEELILLGEDGAPFFDAYKSKSYVISGKTWVNNHAHVFKGILVSHLFLAHYLNVFDYSGRVVGATRSKLNQARAVDIPLPLPPLAEQHRIVAKIDGLMALCDRLEAARTNREATRNRLATASLARLNAPDPDPATFQNHAAFALKNLTPLTTRPDQINALRQTILNLAIRGKLVEQYPNDEPASELLKRIGEEKSGFVSRGRNGRALSGNSEGTDNSFGLPITWRWCRLGDIALGMRYGTARKCHYDIKGTPVLRIPNVSGGRIDLSDIKFGNLTPKENRALALRCGDLLVVRSNGSLDLVGRAAEVDETAVGMSFAGYLVRVRLSPVDLVSAYVLRALNADHVRNQIEKPIRSTVGLKNVNSTELAALTIPLPPLAEQHRIVAKVNELLALCDRLEESLAIGSDTRRRLLDTVLHDALAPGTEPKAAAGRLGYASGVGQRI